MLGSCWMGRNWSLSWTPQASISSPQRKALDQVNSNVPPGFGTNKIYWNLGNRLWSTHTLLHFTSSYCQLINNFTAWKEQPLFVIGPQPKRKKPNLLHYIEHILLPRPICVSWHTLQKPWSLRFRSYITVQPSTLLLPLPVGSPTAQTSLETSC